MVVLTYESEAPPIVFLSLLADQQLACQPVIGLLLRWMFGHKLRKK
jgi:hypothetical protein